MSKNKIEKVVLYEGKNGEVELRKDEEKDTLWATLDQIATVFGRHKSVISRHIKNIFRAQELDEKSTVAKTATVQIENGREVTRMIEYYNLDVILSVGYRVNSKQATQFRIWATGILREYLIKGFSMNSKQLIVSGDKFDDLHKAISFIESESVQGKVKAKVTVSFSKKLL